MKYINVIEDKMLEVNKNITDSFYYKKIRENSLLIFMSLLIAIVCVLISYPGILYSDSYGRVDTADKVRVAINLLLSGQYERIEPMECWITLVPSIFIALAKMLTGNIATYTLAQSFAFFLVSINGMEQDKKEEYLAYLDELAGEGATESALSVTQKLRNDEYNYNLIERMWEWSLSYKHAIV